MFSRRCNYFLLVFLIFSVVLVGCGPDTPAEADTKPVVQTTTDAVPHSREANDLARFLAALPSNPGSPYLALESSTAWVDHKRQLDAAWSKADASLVRGVQEFQQKELASLQLKSGTVFYPFGGPDALMATLYFPENPVYILVGLEPAGTLPTYAQIEKKPMAEYLGDVRSTVASELGRSFFITRQMDHQFRGQVTDGLLLPILHLLVRSNHTVLGFRYIRLNDAGEVIDRAPDYHAPTRYGNKGIEIEFQTDADHSIHKLYYFTVNLANDRLAENQPFLDYVSRLHGATTLLKATSYMMHRREFSMIRDRILESSSAVLQDDSGIPYHWFDQSRWRVQLYGDYDRPYGSFRWIEQTDLRQAYKQPGPKPLPMHVGYGYSKITSNLLLAMLR